MTTYRGGGYSPPPSRRYEGTRASAGPVYSTSFDTGFMQPPRSAAESSLPARASGERLYDAQPVSRREYAAIGHAGTQSKTEYAVRAHRSSSVRDDDRVPLRLLPPSSPNRTGPFINNFPSGLPHSPAGKRYYHPDESGRYILPAKSDPRQHRRHMSGSQMESKYLAPAVRDSRDRTSYRVQDSRAYPIMPPPSRHQDEDGFSYTTPREQFDRDYPPPQRPPHRNSSLRKDSTLRKPNLDDWEIAPPAREKSGPPPTARHFDKLREGESRYSGVRSGNHSDTEQDPHRPRRPHSLRAPVDLHQGHDHRNSPDANDDHLRRSSRYHTKAYPDERSYSSDRENYRSSNHHERHQDRPSAREGSRERSHKIPAVAATGLGGLAVTGVAGALVQRARGADGDSDHVEAHAIKGQHTHERDRDLGDQVNDRERTGEKPKNRALDLRGEAVHRVRRGEGDGRERSESESIDDARGEGHRSRRKHRHRRRDPQLKEHASNSTSGDERARRTKAPGGNRSERESRQENSETSYRDRRHLADHRPVSSEDDKHSSKPKVKEEDEGDGDRIARLQLVEPAQEDTETEIKPKGILKPARQVPFPEDPNPTREGVAPLKDAGKKGIPPGARWTKINRMLVNPDALIAAQERYEERTDYVIVLRVLSRDEIEKLMEQTKKIREAREAERRERYQRKRRDSSSSSGGDNDYEDEEKTHGRPRLAIEAAAPATSIPDFRYPDTSSADNHRSALDPEPVPVAGLGLRT